jgi:hypothetical protein
VTDIREIAAAKPAQTAEGVVRVPTEADVAAGSLQADRAVAEIRARTAEDNRLDEQDRAGQLARWHHQDHGSSDVNTDEVDDAFDVDEADVLTRNATDVE